MVRQIPNLFTLANLFCGACAVVLAVNKSYESAFYLMLLGAFFDFIDGFIARILKASSAIGAQLDSLSDLVTFGMLPSVFIFTKLQELSSDKFIPYIGFMVVLASAYRLAKFNLDSEQSTHFKGLPTPINAVVMAALTLNSTIMFINTVEFFVVYVILSSWLLLSEFKLIALKFKSFGLKENLPQYILTVLSIILLIVFKIAAIPLILPLYLLISFFHFQLKVI